MRLIKLGAFSAIAGLVGALVNLWAREEFPESWGGPNIGGGMLQLLFYALIVVGVILAIAGGLAARRRD
ncbi:hypothetical protein ACIBF5_22075 [Micromonospora sp. NPDC050417]|uniref:hypothetical protein n=1 Tax=Micromonospora sp. NPDC050417 TaxID=3364280 RepID=UPI0037A97C62